MNKHLNTWPLFLLFALTISAVSFSCGKDDDDPNPTATCSDGIQNQNETGIDCGGPCAACPLTDADGNIYTTVTIGTQTWMVENLNTTKYNDGTPIPLRDYSHWLSSEDAAYANLKDEPAQAATYGRLYNWYAVNSGKLAPAGWHVPSHAEWQTLIDFIGGASTGGGKLKETGFTHWRVPNTGATDEFDFTVLPAQWRLAEQPTLAESVENILGTSAHFWTSTSNAVPGFAQHRSFAFDTDDVTGVTTGDIAKKEYGMSVRLIKD